MSILREKVIAAHIDKNYPNAKMVNYDDADSDLIFYDVDQLQEVDDDWFPLCCYMKNGKTVYGGRKGIVHTYTEGETGAGKTTRFVMQSIRALSSMKKKPSFIVVDIHGEIVENLYQHLKENGYKIHIINCDDPKRSDTYNPFADIIEDCLKNKEISNDSINKIRNISEIIQPVESSHDPIWDRGACSYTNGCILDKFEDLINDEIPKESVNLYNIIQNHYWLRRQIGDGGVWDLSNHPHYRKKDKNALSIQKMIGVTNNAERTRASYFGVIENHYDTFGQPSMYSLSSNNTINIQDFFETPTVIVIQSGSTKIGDDLISLLVNDIYTCAVKKGKESKTKRLPRNIHCFLDEFANCHIADGPEYVKMITTSRKFGMFWHMLLQCDAQLDRKFDADIGRIIRANCTEIFMGTHDYETAVRFAKSCGQKTIESLASVMSQSNPYLESVDLITPERVNLLEEGYMYVKSNRCHLLKTYIEAFYNCDDFYCDTEIDAIYPTNDFDYRKTLFLPNENAFERSGNRADRGRFGEPFKMNNTGARATEEGSSDDKDVTIASPYENLHGNNLLYQRIKTHLEKFEKKKVDDVISKLTSFPPILKNVVAEIFSTGKKDAKQVCRLPRSTRIIKFDIIEEYVRNNDFKTKSEWDQKIQKEYDCLKENNLFPECIMILFKDARDEIQNELTFENIQAIKKIITGEDN